MVNIIHIFLSVLNWNIYGFIYRVYLSRKKKKKKEPQDYKKSPVNMSNKLSVNCYTHSYVALIYLNKIKSLGSESFDSDWINISPRLLRDMLWWTWKHFILHKDQINYLKMRFGVLTVVPCPNKQNKYIWSQIFLIGIY